MIAKVVNTKTVSIAIAAVLIAMMLTYTDQTTSHADSGGTIHVASDGQDNDGCGTTSQPCRTIQHAVDMSGVGDVIKIAEGTYYGDGSAVVDIITQWGTPGIDVHIIGGFAPPDWNTPVSDPTRTIIDGEDVRRGINVQGLSENVTNVHLENLTVQHGFVNWALPTEEWYVGGGLLCRNDGSGTVSMTLTDVIFRDNSVWGSGAGLTNGGGASFLYRCPATLYNVTFDYNIVIAGDATDGTRGGHAVGGGIFAGRDSTIEATMLTITNNRVEGGSGGTGKGWGYADGLGGGGAFQLNTVTLRDIIVRGNQAIGGNASEVGGTGSGGGLFFELNTSPISIVGGRLEANQAIGGDSSGGVGGTATGGAIMTTDDVVTLEQLTIVNNKSSGGSGPDGGDAGGGALYFTKAHPENTSKVTGTNLVLADNVSEAGQGDNRWGGGGAVFSQDTELTLIHTTIANNSVLSSMQGQAAVILHNYESSSLNLENSIVSDHTGRGTAIVIQQSGDYGRFDTTLFYNNTNDYGSQAGMPAGTIEVENLVSPGSPEFLSPGSPDYDYHITAGSQAIDVITTQTVSDDIDEESRPFSNASDVGADEYVPLLLNAAPVASGTLQLKWVANYDLLPSFDHFGVKITPITKTNDPTAYAGVINVGKKTTFVADDLTNYQEYSLVVEAHTSSEEVVATSNEVTIMPTDIFVYLPTLIR